MTDWREQHQRWARDRMVKKRGSGTEKVPILVSDMGREK